MRNDKIAFRSCDTLCPLFSEKKFWAVQFYFVIIICETAHTHTHNPMHVHAIRRGTHKVVRRKNEIPERK